MGSLSSADNSCIWQSSWPVRLSRTVGYWWLNKKYMLYSYGANTFSFFMIYCSNDTAIHLHYLCSLPHYFFVYSSIPLCRCFARVTGKYVVLMNRDAFDGKFSFCELEVQGTLAAGTMIFTSVFQARYTRTSPVFTDQRKLHSDIVGLVSL